MVVYAQKARAPITGHGTFHSSYFKVVFIIRLSLKVKNENVVM